MQNLQNEADIARDYLAKIAKLAEQKFDARNRPSRELAQSDALLGLCRRKTFTPRSSLRSL